MKKIGIVKRPSIPSILESVAHVCPLAGTILNAVVPNPQRFTIYIVKVLRKNKNGLVIFGLNYVKHKIKDFGQRFNILLEGCTGSADSL